jgi:oligopeptide transport system ATP-binding protein
MANKVLEVRNLHTKFHTSEGVIYAVNGISFEIQAGKTLGIVGESGCGKSVSVLSVLKLLPEPPAVISVDRILFKDNDLTHAKESEMRAYRGSQMAMIFQDPMTSLNPVLSIGFQIMESLKFHLSLSHEDAKARAIELLHLVGIPNPKDRLSDFPHQFSGGMRQRAMVAMAISCDPSLLIADEPTTALDVTIQAQIVDLVKRLRDSYGMSLIWITHDLGVVAGLADMVNVMYAGFVVESGEIDEIYDNPQHPYTIALLRSLPSIEKAPKEKLVAIEGSPPSLLQMPTFCQFSSRCPFAKEICLSQIPPLIHVMDRHSVACWFDLTSGNLRR